MSLRDSDQVFIDSIESLYTRAMQCMAQMNTSSKNTEKNKQELIDLYGEIGKQMQQFVSDDSRIHVYSFKTPRDLHAEASYLISKMRNHATNNEEFVYFTQRAYELLFNFSFLHPAQSKKNYFIVPTPVDSPVQNLAVHKVPDVDDEIRDTAMCVMLRGALLPSMIMSKAIQEYSSTSYVTPFSLFKIQRDERENDALAYTVNLESSFFKAADLHDRHLIVADPMNATGGSLITIIRYLEQQQIKPRSIRLFTVISALRGVMHILRNIEGIQIYTLWMDPMLNERSYIMPGLGDAGDRINGQDNETEPRNIIQLIADYGLTINNLYRAQVKAIEKCVFKG